MEQRMSYEDTAADPASLIKRADRIAKERGLVEGSWLGGVLDDAQKAKEQWPDWAKTQEERDKAYIDKVLKEAREHCYGPTVPEASQKVSDMSM
jgi:hypothetical protein